MKCINILYTFLLLTTAKGVFGQSQAVIINSPNKRLSLTVFTADKKLVYSIQSGSTPIITTSALGLVIDNMDLGDNVRIIDVATLSKINETYTILGNHSITHNRANEAEIPMVASGKKFSIIVRVYNDGVAIRYGLPPNSKRIDSERTTWTLPNNVTKIAWADFSQSYEGSSYVTTGKDT
ncbi:glycosyl hydrolase family 97 [Chitinophaga polysaccharea]|uniref:Glycosyl hydrolase family 97 n=1 Tax=Chitinophaga polysaccharea TaxID=1293035 RepID=A0A561Q5U4_9BACT|nr:glycoside hydrolase family 97 N-terminal domain-containing protein [Chitinophaga polysaccharea]TWF45728.1 glycosyl hydrolase family 97 [Chitinophaga polysaccharea]